MNKYLISLVLVFTAITSFAQSSIFNNPDNKAYFGIRVGADITCPGNISAQSIGINAFNNGAGIEFGGIYNVPVVANFYIEPGLKLYYDTYSYKDEFVDAIESSLTGASMRKFGMRIPVMAGYHFDFTEDVKVSVFTGPELEIGFTAKEHLKGGSIEVSESVYGSDGGMNRVNLLWGIGAGISIKHFYIGVNGGIGMLNMFNDSGMSFHENRVTIGLGYNF